MQQIIDEEVGRILRQADDRAFRMLEEHRDELERVTEALIEREVLTAAEIEELIGKRPTDDSEPVGARLRRRNRCLDRQSVLSFASSWAERSSSPCRNVAFGEIALLTAWGPPSCLPFLAIDREPWLFAPDWWWPTIFARRWTTCPRPAN